MNLTESPEDIEKQIKKLQESGQAQLDFEDKCKKSMLREYYINRTETFMKNLDNNFILR
jgi:hypothetical protein